MSCPEVFVGSGAVTCRGASNPTFDQPVAPPDRSFGPPLPDR